MTVAAYRDRTSGAYPIQLFEVRQRAKNFLFGETPTKEILDAANVDSVETSPQPSFNATQQYLIEDVPKQLNGKWVQVWKIVNIVPTDDAVDNERDRRIESGFEFNGKRYQSRAKDRENILGAASLAHMALTIGGKSPDDPKWHGGDSNFVWIAEDNSLIPMTAPVVIEFGRVAAEHKSAHTFAARALKSVETPADYTDDRYWP